MIEINSLSSSHEQETEQEKRNTKAEKEAKEIAKKKGMAKQTSGAAETGDQV